jgi:hypothetical protein
MVELRAQFALVDDLAKADMLRAVDDRKGDALIRIESRIICSISSL